ncbi:MAG: hypothetical protein PW789_09900 [Edaphobacter sp.]|uniref:hypothetical protein n=1 Tax=Edaphobacter sp. TaxID=1934404 RepID=UPI0023946EB5|nr:hypothetical protein [Edaphobacter sp.]MDE1176905.1 hypothetical protein [Edaphobacter sp.]
MAIHPAVPHGTAKESYLAKNPPQVTYPDQCDGAERLRCGHDRFARFGAACLHSVIGHVEQLLVGNPVGNDVECVHDDERLFGDYADNNDDDCPNHGLDGNGFPDAYNNYNAYNYNDDNSYDHNLVDDDRDGFGYDHDSDHDHDSNHDWNLYRRLHGHSNERYSDGLRRRDCDDADDDRPRRRPLAVRRRVRVEVRRPLRR